MNAQQQQAIVLQPVPGHPWASYAAGYDRFGRYFIHCACSFPGCTDRGPHARRCSRPHLTQARVFEFATLHGHGLRPVVGGRR